MRHLAWVLGILLAALPIIDLYRQKENHSSRGRSRHHHSRNNHESRRNRPYDTDPRRANNYRARTRSSSHSPERERDREDKVKAYVELGKDIVDHIVDSGRRSRSGRTERRY